MITSPSNNSIKHVALLQQKASRRREEGCFVIEGARLCGEAPPQLLRELYLSEKFAQKDEGKALLRMAEEHHIPTELVAEDVFHKLSDTRTPQGVVGVVSMPSYNIEEMFDTALDEGARNAENTPLFMILEDLQDPGNLGTIMRTAEGAGVSGVILSRESVDLFNPKVVRATMGSIFRVPFLYTEDLHGTMKQLQEHGVTIYAAHLRGEDNYDRCDFRRPTAFLIGNEGNGLKKETADAADLYMRIPMRGKLESLNAAVASALLMYEADRQRRI